MTHAWKSNEEKDQDDELVVTEHRDRTEPNVTADTEQSIEMVEDTLQESVEVLGEDVASSAAERGHDNVDEESGG